MTVNDYLIGTRAGDLQVKTLGVRKPSIEVHMADVVADAVFPAVMFSRFRRRVEVKDRGATGTIDRLIKNYEKVTLSSLIVTADRGYGRDYFAECFCEKGISFILIMPQHVSKIHSILLVSLLTVGRDD